MGRQHLHIQIYIPKVLKSRRNTQSTFYDNKYTKTKLPPLRTMAEVPANPFIAAKSRSNKRSKEESNEVEIEVLAGVEESLIQQAREEISDEEIEERNAAAEGREGEGEHKGGEEKREGEGKEEREEKEEEKGEEEGEGDENLESRFSNNNSIAMSESMLEARILECTSVSLYISSKEEEEQEEQEAQEISHRENVVRTEEMNKNQDILPGLSCLQLSDKSCDNIATQIASLIFEKQRAKESE